jgi:hypothetical protein
MSKPDISSVGGLNFGVGFPGQIADASSPRTVETRINEAAAAVDFGVAVTRGVATTPGVTGNCKPMTTNGQVPIGIALREASTKTATTDGNNTINYPRYSEVPVLKAGRVFVTAAENATEGDAVVVLAADGTLGSATGGAANGGSRMAFDGAVWETTVTAGNVGLVRLVNRV